MVDESMWTTSSMFLKTVDKFNESLISAILISIDEKRRSADVGRGGVTLPPLPK